MRSATARALAALARLQWFAPLGVFTAQRFVRSLSQVVRYLNEPGMREKVQARVGGHVTADTVL